MAESLADLEMEDSEMEEAGALPPLDEDDRNRLLRAINGESMQGAFPFLDPRGDDSHDDEEEGGGGGGGGSGHHHCYDHTSSKHH